MSTNQKERAMRLYPLGTSRTVIDHPAWGHFEADEDHGGFDLPDELSDELHSFHHRGKALYEDEDERSVRLHGDELARQRDPATLYAAIGELVGLAKKAGAADATPEPPAAKSAPKAAPAPAPAK